MADNGKLTCCVIYCLWNVCQNSYLLHSYPSKYHFHFVKMKKLSEMRVRFLITLINRNRQNSIFSFFSLFFFIFFFLSTFLCSDSLTNDKLVIDYSIKSCFFNICICI